MFANLVFGVHPTRTQLNSISWQSSSWANLLVTMVTFWLPWLPFGHNGYLLVNMVTFWLTWLSCACAAHVLDLCHDCAPLVQLRYTYAAIVLHLCHNCDLLDLRHNCPTAGRAWCVGN